MKLKKIYKPNMICSWCGDPIKIDEARIFDEYDEEWLHLICSVEKDERPSDYGYEGDGQ